ncbi:cell division protein ZapA [Dissulfurirhabdus thermomarina]|uniref:Cell division protein ZapA n=1 Tax=Dissulfurirhabdus thermomarina TaxID=1765737 RepID=A0A6N9TNS3_DISTH|nr:cell division protein ZapA [Dissulfurirhabdus thermomarina]NDY42080.1 cell division protein ZapA [Dissulfurirhabdus thermomarina]NMX22830.1 cell division protein ZapA [Dissulfurirhabdus thermomarina]
MPDGRPADPGTVVLELFGQVYHLRAEAEDVDIREVVAHVREKVAEQERLHPGLPPHKLMVLTVLTLAKELVQVRARAERLEAVVSDKARHLAAQIDAVVKVTETAK